MYIVRYFFHLGLGNQLFPTNNTTKEFMPRYLHFLLKNVANNIKAQKQRGLPGNLGVENTEIEGL